ncbi:Bidirectional sugar transporter SWEET15 [Bienertia sinuspersici]
MLWLYYGLLKNKEHFIISINSVGCIIETLYLAFYYVYASKNARIYTAILVISLNVVIFSVIVLIIQILIDDSSNRVRVLGIICAVVSTSVFAAPLTIIVKVIRTKSVEFMPFPLSFFLTLCAVIWFLYGILRNDIFIYIPNVFGFVLGLLQMVLYAVCKNCCVSKESDQSSTNNTVNGNLATFDHHEHHRHQIETEQVIHQMAHQQKRNNEVQLPTVGSAV